MAERQARCSCGAVSIAARGEPIKISACHCDACRLRTGSAFGVAVFYGRGDTSPEGPSSAYTRPGDSGQTVTFHFCPTCGSTVFWYPAFRPDWVGIAIGCFETDDLRPTQAVYEERRLDWVAIEIDKP